MFQKKVIEKYLSKINRELLTEKYALYCSIFINKEKQENIRNSKEEQYQEGFIRDLFCSVLGYTIKPEANYNILTELKNESKSNSKKSDGAIIINDEVKAVIELKGTDTQDLDKVAFQAFSYKNHHEKCNYVIVSNFERLRLYVETQIEYIEFNLFNLPKDSFDLLYLLLQLENITNDIPLKLKHETLSEEKEITNNFYSDYSTFKRCLFEDLIENNPEIDKLLLFKKTQKLLDRILFILFCEDRNLLPTNSTMGIINDYKKLKELGYYQPLYNVFKTFFDRIDKGFKHDTDKSKDVFAYNGGLFKPDEILDSVKVGDDVLYIHSQRLANYDFESQISVDILGRIFENSLTEIEEVQNEIENEKNGIKTENNNIGKRKKDGVFYTPEYITKYIVENTIGKLCEAKKEELKINDSEYTFDKKYQKKTIEQLDDRLNKYRDWLLSLKILDCACGSGAFLNSALRELRKEHTLIDYFWSKIHKNELNFSQIDNTILENNLYGVDINEDSIEITKLSLWLHTATRNRKLTTLNDKIKCGNSLIDDESIAGEKAFDWKKEFPEVFEKGGFDVIISNPPYVRIQGIKSNKENESIYYEKNYKSAIGRYDLYILFLEKAFSLINNNGLVSFIMPHNFLIADLGKGIRNYLSKTQSVNELIHFGSNLVFEEAQTYTCIIKLTSKKNDFINYASINPNELTNKRFNFTSIDYNNLTDEKWNLTDNESKEVLNKILKAKYKVSDYFSNVGRGIVSGFDDCFILKGEIRNNLFSGYSKALNEKIEIEANLVKPILMGNSVHSYSKLENELFIIYPHIENNGKTEPIDEDNLKNTYPKTYNYLLNFKEQLVAKKIKYKTNPNFWYSLHNSREITLFNDKKIITPYLANKCQMSFDKDGIFITNDKCSILKLKKEYENDYLYFLPILNSKLCFYFIKNTSSEFQGNYFVFSNLFINPFPIPEIAKNKESFIRLAEKMLSLNEDLQKKVNRFISRIKETYNLEKATQNIESFYNRSFADFVKELSKQKIKLSMKQKDELEDYFNEYVKDISALNETIEKTDKEINSLVYSLYNLTDEEIKVIES